MMTSRERVLAALNHTKPDRPPLNYFGTRETTARLLRHFGLSTIEELRVQLGADMRYVSPAYVGPSCFSGLFGEGIGGTDMWGIEWEATQGQHGISYNPCRHPLAQARSVADIMEYTWPKADWLSAAGIAKEVSNYNRAEPRAIVLYAGSFLEIAWMMRGLERFLMDMIETPEIIVAILGQVTNILLEVLNRAVAATDGAIDIVWSAGDVGMQTGMLLSPTLWREYVKPFHRQLVEPFRKMGLKNRYHTDGAVFPIIEDLIEIGIDLLDPIQPNTPDMDPENLAHHFGGRMAFYGGVDTQLLLPFGQPRDIEQKVLDLIRILGRDGAYVVAASNAVQSDVPMENILTLYRTAREYECI